ncbi:MAG: hypothetical protein Q6M54_00065, partial [Thermostichus sp. DRC_bins_24]
VPPSRGQRLAIDGSHLMTIDNNLLWVLIGTAGISLLTLVYVLVDEGNKRRRYEQQKQEQQKQREASPSSSPSVAPEEASGIPAAPSAPEATQPVSEGQETSPEPEPSPVDSSLPEESKAAAETPETAG